MQKIHDILWLSSAYRDKVSDHADMKNESLEEDRGAVFMAMDNRYSDGSQFLEEVTVKIQNRLDEIDRDLNEGKKEIENMHEYYWRELYGDGSVWL